MTAVIERVVLVLDAAAESGAAISAAVRLAADAKTPLHGVFVEDEDLLRLAALPVARQLIHGGATASLTTEEIELQLRAAAFRVRRDLLIATQARAVAFSFEVVRGSAESILSAASDRDVVVAGALARPVAGQFRVESRWLTALERVPGRVLLTRESQDRRGAVVLLRERSAGSARLLQAAARIAELRGAPLTVISPPPLAESAGFADWVDEQIEPSAVHRQFEAAPAEPTAFHARIAELDCGLLAIGAGTAEGGPERRRELTERLDCDVLVVG